MTAMSNEAEGENKNKVGKGNVKTEVPNKVQWARRTFSFTYFTLSKHILLVARPYQDEFHLQFHAKVPIDLDLIKEKITLMFLHALMCL